MAYRQLLSNPDTPRGHYGENKNMIYVYLVFQPKLDYDDLQLLTNCVFG
jgi:hypothetical protein